MLHVVCMILKIILFILLGILGLLLLLCLIVLFSPVRYQAEVSYHGKKSVYTLAKIRYIIVSCRILYNQKSGESKQEISVLGIKLGKRRKKTKKETFDDWDEDIEEDEAKTECVPVSEISEEDEAKTECVPVSEISEEDEAKAEPAQISEALVEDEAFFEDETTGVPPSFAVEDNSDLEENEKTWWKRLRLVLQKMTAGIRNVWKFFYTHTLENMISAWWTRLEEKKKDFTRKLKRLQKFWNLSCTAKTRAYLKKYIPKTLRHVLPRKITGTVTYGMDEPCKTGQITGYISLLPFVYQKHLTIQPDFSKKIFELDIRLKGHITLGYLLRIVLNVNIWRTIKVARKIMKH